MSDYTVIGHWTDNGQPWIWHVTAESSMEAASRAVDELCSEHEVGPDSFTIVEVIQGFHEGMLNNEACIRGDEIETYGQLRPTFTIDVQTGLAHEGTRLHQRQEEVQRQADQQTNRIGNRGIDF